MHSVPEYTKKEDIELSDIFKPVNKELMALERKMVESLSGSNKLLTQVSEYIISAGGKRLRPAVCFLISKALNNGFVSSNHFQLGQGLELIHTATLIHDDVIDETNKRRSQETVGYRWDNKTAIIAGDFLLSRALINLTFVKSNAVMQIFANTMSEICEGEIDQNLQKFQVISIEEYIDKSRKKTANLFIAGAESAAILTPDADNTTIRAAREFALNFGIAFQIVDDILNFTANEKVLGKPSGIDLQNGILTAPVLFAIKEYDQNGDKSFRELIQTEFKDKENFIKALDLVVSSNGIQQANDLAKYYSDLAVKSLDLLEDSVYKASLQALSCYLLKKNS